VIVVATAIVACGASSGCDGFRFDREAWVQREMDGPTRFEVAREIAACGDLEGKTHAAVRRQLGAPDRRTATSWVYGVDWASELGSDAPALELEFQGRPSRVVRVYPPEV
jgi:hypothetical protein